MTPTTLMDIGVPLRIFSGDSLTMTESYQENLRHRARREVLRRAFTANVILPILREWDEALAARAVVTWPDDAPANVPATLPKSDWIGEWPADVPHIVKEPEDGC